MASQSQIKINLATDRTHEPQTDRRSRRRALIALPLRVRRELSHGEYVDDISVTLDVSRGGVLFRTFSPDYRSNMPVRVTLPYDATGNNPHSERDARVLRVKSSPDGRFTVALSFGRLAVNPVRGAFAGGSLYTGGAANTKPVAIVIDADPHIRLSVSHFLRMDGYEVIAARTFREVRDHFETSAPRLLIAENEGTDFSANELHALLRGTPRLRNVPLVLLTNSPFANAVTGASSDPNIVYVTKPFRPQQFREVVRLLSPSKAPGGFYAGL